MSLAENYDGIMPVSKGLYNGNMMKNKIFGAIYLSLAAGIWGGMYVVSKVVLEFILPVTLVWLRYAIAFIVLFILLKMAEGKSPNPVPMEKRDWILIAWIGFIGYFVSVSLQFMGTKLSDAHTGALLTSATPAFTVLFARWVLGELLYLRKILSLILATIGVIVVIGWDKGIGDSHWGNLLLVGAAVTWALLTVYVKKASHRQSSLTITTYGVFFALLFTTPIMMGEVLSGQGIVLKPIVIPGVLYLGIVSTAGAFFLWNKGMEVMEAGIGSLFFFFQPVVGSVLGWMLLGESISINFYIGGALILLGVLLDTSIIKIGNRKKLATSGGRKWRKISDTSVD